MTIGEKIKYLRKRRGITQGKLAQLSGIHPVSIRKYETNKMIPQPAQLEKIADALGASHFALSDISDSLKIETTGDFVGLLINLIKSSIIVLSGNRDKSGVIDSATMTVELNPLIVKLFTADIGEKTFNLSDLKIALKDKTIINKILSWETFYYRYKIKCEELEGVTDPEPLGYLKEYEDILDELELEVTCGSMLLDTSNGIIIKIPPDWHN